MADEQAVTEQTEQATETAAEVQATESTATETTTEERKPHPLEPGGPRFEEVYARMKASEERERLLLQQMQTPKPAAQPAAQFYTHEQLQVAVDRGQITPSAASAQLAFQAKEQAKQEMRTEFRQETRQSSALAEVNSYIAKKPALTDTTSTDFRQVAAVAYEIAEDMGLPVSDARVQRRALRETYGPLDKVATVTQRREFDRQHADTYVEAGGGGGGKPPAKDPLKDVEPERIAYWTKLGYTRAQMVEESQHIKKPLRRVR